jgi:IS30 family transposase
MRLSHNFPTGLLRQYFPKGSDLSRHSPGDLAAVATASTADHAKPSAGRPCAARIFDCMADLRCREQS